MLKKIIITFSLFIIFMSSVFADISIELSSDKTSAIVNENFTLDIKVKNDGGKDLNIEDIKGIENFNKVSQRNYFTSSNINGVVNLETSLQFVVNGINPGEYSIGPVVLNDGEKKYSSNIIKIIIKDELLNTSLEKEDINSVKKINLLLKNFLYSPTFIFIFFILLISIYLLFIKSKNEIEYIQDAPDKLEIIKTELIKLKNEIDEIEKNIFYGKFNIIFRKYFENIGIIGASQLTLKELGTKQIDNDIFNLFKKSYSKEFSNYKDNKSSRIKIIEEFEEILNR